MLEVAVDALVVIVDVGSVDSDSPVVVPITEDVNCASVGEDILVVDGSWLVDGG